MRRGSGKRPRTQDWEGRRKIWPNSAQQSWDLDDNWCKRRFSRQWGRISWSCANPAHRRRRWAGSAHDREIRPHCLEKRRLHQFSSKSQLCEADFRATSPGSGAVSPTPVFDLMRIPCRVVPQQFPKGKGRRAISSCMRTKPSRRPAGQAQDGAGAWAVGARCRRDERGGDTHAAWRMGGWRGEGRAGERADCGARIASGWLEVAFRWPGGWRAGEGERRWQAAGGRRARQAGGEWAHAPVGEGQRHHISIQPWGSHALSLQSIVIV